jgi:hypothetical protein
LLRITRSAKSIWRATFEGNLGQAVAPIARATNNLLHTEVSLWALQKKKNIIKEYFRLKLSGYDSRCAVYLLLCNGGRVTVRSQQMRAMNLAWALQEELREKTNVAVIGGCEWGG